MTINDFGDAVSTVIDTTVINTNAPDQSESVALTDCPAGKFRKAGFFRTAKHTPKVIKTRVRSVVFFLILTALILSPVLVTGQTAIPKLTIGVDQAASAQDVAVTIQILVLLTILTLAPSILILMTSFTRIIIVLHFIRQAMGTQQMPPNQVLIGLALFLTFFIMQQPIKEIYDRAWVPYEEERITIQAAYEVAQQPLKEFMLRQTREKDLALFVKLANLPQPDTAADLPLTVVVPGFVISELRVAFQIGFLVYMPFLIIDMVVASILMSMGMLMLPPVLISLPFKILMFVLVDGWYLVVESVVMSFK